MTLTDAQRDLLEDKVVLWERASRVGAEDLRDYNRRAAEALKIALSICSALQARVAALEAAARPFAKIAEQYREGSYGFRIESSRGPGPLAFTREDVASLTALLPAEAPYGS
jgi:hypothetical protein